MSPAAAGSWRHRPARPPWDINADGVVNIADVALLGQRWMETGPPGWLPEDVNLDGIVNIAAVPIVGLHWLQTD